METPDQRVDLVDASNLLRAAQYVDDAGVPAGGEHHEPAITQGEADGVLVPVLIGLRLSGKFLGGEMVVHIGVRVAAQSVSNTVFPPGVRQYVLNAGARDHAGGEGLAFND